MRRFTIGAAAAAVLLSAAAGASVADAASYRSSSSFGFFAGSPDAFLGELSSPHVACERGRRIEVLRELRGGRARLVGRTLSSQQGQWKLERADVPRARYYAVVLASRAGRHSCRAYRSSTLRFGG